MPIMKMRLVLCAAERKVASSAEETRTRPELAAAQEFQLKMPSSEARVLKKEGVALAW
jgi:hypothetical protein